MIVLCARPLIVLDSGLLQDAAAETDANVPTVRVRDADSQPSAAHELMPATREGASPSERREPPDQVTVGGLFRKWHPRGQVSRERPSRYRRPPEYLDPGGSA